MSDILTDECRRVVAEWARHFNVPVPTIKIRVGGRAHYTYRNGRHLVRRITIPRFFSTRTGKHSFYDTLVHEFSHHLDYAAAEGRIGYRPQHSHGATFRSALVQVATLAYGDPKQYGWQDEYKPVSQWATKRRLAWSATTHAAVPGIETCHGEGCRGGPAPHRPHPWFSCTCGNQYTGTRGLQAHLMREKSFVPIAEARALAARGGYTLEPYCDPSFGGT